jgi:hypothetical protein
MVLLPSLVLGPQIKGSECTRQDTQNVEVTLTDCRRLVGYQICHLVRILGPGLDPDIGFVAVSAPDWGLFCYLTPGLVGMIG